MCFYGNVLTDARWHLNICCVGVLQEYLSHLRLSDMVVTTLYTLTVTNEMNMINYLPYIYICNVFDI